MIERVASKLCWRKLQRSSARSWKELDEFQSLTPDLQKKILAERLLLQVQYFGKREDALPEWRDAARIGDPEELWRLWPSLPVLDKRALQTKFVPGEIQRRFGIDGSIRSTGGSTGEPTHVLHDLGMTLACNAASFYTRLRMGWRPGMATVILWGSERDIGRQQPLRSRIYTRLLRDLIIDGYQLNRGTVDRALELIRRHRPIAMQGFTSMLAYAARTVLDAGCRVPPGSVRTAWNGGEMLYPEQSRLFEQAFGVPILNRYGGRELSVMACQFEPEGALQILRPWVFVEIVDGKGNPAAPGEPGRLLLTSTVCRGTPFLRYDVGDLGSCSPSHSGEAGVTHLSAIEGRFSGLLELPDGRKINCIYWNHLFKEFAEIRQFQVALRGREGLEIRLEGSGMSQMREAELRNVLRGFLGETQVKFTWMDRIPLTRLGKLVQVVREESPRGEPVCATERS